MSNRRFAIRLGANGIKDLLDFAKLLFLALKLNPFANSRNGWDEQPKQDAVRLLPGFKAGNQNRYQALLFRPCSCFGIKRRNLVRIVANHRLSFAWSTAMLLKSLRVAVRASGSLKHVVADGKVIGLPGNRLPCLCKL